MNATVTGVTPLIALTGLTGQTTPSADGTNLATSPVAFAQHVWAYTT